MSRRFEHVVCLVDGSPESLEAARQAAELRPADARLTLLAAADVVVAERAGWGATPLIGALEDAARDALTAARAAIDGDADERLVRGATVPALLHALTEEEATLAVVGTRGHRRATGIVLGSVSTAIVHDAACSVLVARRREGPVGRICVGTDGSPQAAEAVRAAGELAERFGASLELVVATGGKGLADPAELPPGATVTAGKPTHALVEASARADLLVVGSRGLHGLRSLGSVAERVAHDAACPVLVVRG